MLRPIFIFALFFLIAERTIAQDVASPSAQSANCTQVLRLARAVYEQGRLHELETLLKDCLAGDVGTSNGFSTVQERVDAYRLLCLSYIYLEEPAKADEAMLGILNTDHFFALNPTDPAEFQALYKTFRTEPVFNWGARIAGNLNMSHIQKVYNMASESAGKGKYLPGVSFAGGVFAEREFFPKAKEGGFLNNTLVRAEIYYLSRGTNINFDRLWSKVTANQYGSAISGGKVAASWLDLNILARYRYNRKSLWDPYVGIAGGISYLLGAKLNLAKFEQESAIKDGDEIVGTTAGTSFSGPAVDVKKAYFPFTQSASVVLGVNRKVGQLYFNVEARYQYGFSNLINGKNRTVSDMTEYAFTFNDFNQSNVIVNVGVTIPQFSPKKLHKK